MDWVVIIGVEMFIEWYLGMVVIIIIVVDVRLGLENLVFGIGNGLVEISFVVDFVESEVIVRYCNIKW